MMVLMIWKLFKYDSRQVTKISIEVCDHFHTQRAGGPVKQKMC